VGVAQGRLVQGVIDSSMNFEGLYTFANFCFDFNPEGDNLAGTIKYQFTGDLPAGRNVRALSFSDLDTSWGKVFNNGNGQFRQGNTCEDIQGFAAGNAAVQPGQWEMFPIRQRIRPRFWYFALSCCDCSENELDGIEFSVHLLNDQTGWPEADWEFGVDERGMNVLFLFFFIFYLAYYCLHAYALKELLSMNGTIHQFIILFTGITVFSFVAVFLAMYHWTSYGGNGVGHPVLNDIGTIIDTFARILFMGLLMFLSEGWTISQVSLPTRSKTVIIGSLSFTFIMYTLLLIWDFTGRRPERVVPNTAQQVLTYIIISFWIFFAIYFSTTCVNSFLSLNPGDESQKPKRNLFIFLGICYGVWIISLPVISYVGIILSPWVYLIATTTTNVVATGLGYVLFTGIIWPTHASKYFGEPARSAATLSDDDYRRL
jgi:hypothetical protein